MLKYILFVLFAMSISLFSAENFYDLKAKKIDGDTLFFSELKGKKLMIVNVASYCGYTYQYAELQSLYKQYGGPEFEIIGFPANNFSNQEPGSDQDIIDFCTSKYDVTFTMMSKISVVGTDKHSVYQWLTLKTKNGVANQEVIWNFQKYLISKTGQLSAIYGTQTSPVSKEIVDWVKDGLSNIEEIAKPELNIFPNPASDYIDLTMNSTINGDINIYNIYGELLISMPSLGSSDICRINIQELMSGIYFVEINGHKLNFIKI